MPQYGAGVSFSKMKRSMKKKKSNTHAKTNKDSREKHKHKHKHKQTRKKINRKQGVSSHTKACQCGTHNYTGSEPTPRGLGNCEECIPLHVVLRGKDGQLYENKGTVWSLL